MGNYIGMMLAPEESELKAALFDHRYNASQNNMIKHEISRLNDVVRLLKESEWEKANELLLQVYVDNKLDYAVIDNWFCYHLGNKLNACAGITPLHPELNGEEYHEQEQV